MRFALSRIAGRLARVDAMEVCRECAGPRLVWGRVPPEASTRCQGCGRQLNYVVVVWRDGPE